MKAEEPYKILLLFVPEKILERTRVNRYIIS